MTRGQFIQQIGPEARNQMKQFGILASLIIAQACLESNFGQSGLAQKDCNLFGIKGNGPAGSSQWPTTEYVNDKPVQVMAYFKKYNCWEESIVDHTQLFVKGLSWDPNHYRNLVGEKDYKVACLKVRQDGYATDPDYTQKLIDLIETYELNQWDKEEEENIDMQFNGTCIVEKGETSVGAIRLNGEVYVPLRQYEESQGNKVKWDSSTNTVTVTEE